MFNRVAVSNLNNSRCRCVGILIVMHYCEELMHLYCSVFLKPLWQWAKISLNAPRALLQMYRVDGIHFSHLFLR